MNIRLETEKDYFENENLTREAFWDVYRPGCSEHLVLHDLRSSSAFIKELDLVAEENGKLIGNIVYAKMYRDGVMCNDIIGFGPVSVLPEMQKKGIGSKLINESLKMAKEMDFKAVMITGDSNYYSRFGFVSASSFDVHLSGIPLEDEAPFFMALELEKGFLSTHSGVYDFDGKYNVSDIMLEEFEKLFPPKMKREPREGDL
ncbi:MAG: GNAT family N-acetyltransferase [Oscillospiraceae bacterium]